MFAIVRTGGKQYRVAAGDKIAVEKIAGEAGDSVTLDDVLMTGDGGDVKGPGALTVAAEIVAQAKGEKVIVFKKRRRHNYRRKAGHRQQYTILQIVSIGGQKAETKKVETKKTDAKADVKAEAAPAAEKPAKAPKAEAAPRPEAPVKGGAGTPAEAKAEAPKKAAATKAAPAPKADDQADAAPAKKTSTKKAKSATDAAEGDNQA